jgi:hypothetical protein
MGLVNDPSQCIQHNIDVWRDMQAIEVTIIAGIDDNRKLFLGNDLDETL